MTPEQKEAERERAKKQRAEKRKRMTEEEKAVERERSKVMICGFVLDCSRNHFFRPAAPTCQKSNELQSVSVPRYHHTFPFNMV